MGKGKAIAGFVLGIIGLLMGFGFISSLLALPISVTGLILAVSGGKQLRAAEIKFGLSTAALVITIIATSFCGVTFFTCGVCVLCTAVRAAEFSLFTWEYLSDYFEEFVEEYSNLKNFIGFGRI